jgi:hypothetical protein
MQIFLETSIAVISLGASAFCIYEGIRYAKARRRVDQITSEYIGVVNSQALQQGSADSLADQIVMCGGCGGYMPRSVSDACPGPEMCAKYKEILAEHHAS